MVLRAKLSGIRFDALQTTELDFAFEKSLSQQEKIRTEPDDVPLMDLYEGILKDVPINIDTKLRNTFS